MLLKKYIIAERQRILKRMPINTFLPEQIEYKLYRLECRGCNYREKNYCNYRYGRKCLEINNNIIYYKYKPVLCLLKGLL